MKPENRTRMMIWAIVVLAVLNITTILTIMYHRHEPGPEITVPVSGTIGEENSSVRFSGRWFRDELDLSAEQMNRFREFNPAFRQHVRNINLQLNDLRRKMLDEMSSPDSDSARLNSLADSVGYLHADLKRQTYRYYMNFKDICNEEQKEKLDRLFGEMFAADVQTGRYGPGGPYGKGRGRRFMN
ncbi:MAG: periplasmic heavy metal sensor [Bacteroidales bacterium]